MTPDDPKDSSKPSRPADPRRPEAAAPRPDSGTVTLPKVPAPPAKNAAGKAGPADNAPPARETAAEGEATRRRIQLALLEKRRQEKRRWVRTQRFKFLIRLIYVFMLGATLWVVYENPFWIYRQPRFELVGNTLMAERHLAPIVADEVGKPLFRIDPRQLEAAVARHYPILDQVHVRRYLFPARLVFYMVEKRPVALLYDTVAVRPVPASKPARAGAKGLPAASKPAPKPVASPVLQPGVMAPFAMVTEDHDVIPTALYKMTPGAFRTGALNRPVARIIVPHALSGGQTPPRATLRSLHEVLYKVGAIPGLHLLSLTYIPAVAKTRQPEQVVLQFAEGKVLLGQLDSEVFRRLDRLPALAPKMLAMKKGLAYVDLRWGEQTTFKMKAQVVVTPEPPPAV